MKTLDEAGRVKYINVSGGHLGISKSDMKKYVVPYIIDHTQDDDRKQVEPEELKDILPSKRLLDGSSSYNWPQSIQSFISEVLGLTEDSVEDPAGI